MQRQPPAPPPRAPNASFGRPAVNFQFSIFVEGTFGAAFRVEAKKTRLYTFGIDPLAVAGLEILAIRPCSKTGAVVLIVVENRANVLFKVRVICGLNNDV